ncbi:MAG: SDR family NAD(P)-dependent oxidoreductase [Thermodesulfobacteriota bacterium]
MTPYSFAGKHTLITGASGGLGSALARRLAGTGARLIVTSRSMTALNELIASLPASTDVIPITADLSIPGEADALARKALEALGHVDVIFNNAGIGYFALMEEATDENIRYLFEVNTFAPLALIKALIPSMRKRGHGRIVNVVSAAGRVPIPSVGVYGGSKSALAVMTNTMRLEVAPWGIDIINVYPGTIDSSFEENALRENDRQGLCPTDRCGDPKIQIADQVVEAACGPPGEVWLERPGKWLSAAALIWPKFVDSRLQRIRDKVVRKKSLKAKRWRLLQVESALACNLRCIMCPWIEFRAQAPHRGLMPQEVWDAIRPHLSQVRTVDFTGGGEPLLQPRLAEWMAEAKSEGCETGILTNGLLLNKEMAEKLLSAGMDWLCVSIDAATQDLYEKIRRGSNFDTVCSNLARIGEMRSGKLPKTMINFVIMHMNAHQVEDMVRLAATLGVDQVNFKQCDVIRGDHGKGFGVIRLEESDQVRGLKRALARARGLAKKLRIEITEFPFVPTEQPVCDQDPRNSMFVRFDGTVAPCINLALGGPTTFLGTDVVMPTVHYGRIPENDLLELWECETCTFYRTRFQDRVRVYEDVFMRRLTGGSGGNQDKVQQEAVRAMLEAPEGCKVCHYLYDV